MTAFPSSDESFVRPQRAGWTVGEACLAGGTWLVSEHRRACGPVRRRDWVSPPRSLARVESDHG